MKIDRATDSDLAEILKLQYLAYQSEAILLGNFSIPPLLQTLDELRSEFEQGTLLKAVEDSVIIGSVRGRLENTTLLIGKFIVHPGFRSRGIGSQLLLAIEKLYPGVRYELFTSSKSERNIALYERLGYRRFAEQRISSALTFVYLEKNAATASTTKESE